MSSRPTWRGDDLADRLGVTERSIRRDITRLRDLGYPIQSVTGPYGGYSLGAGGQLPPLLLSDDEAVSIAAALHHITHRSSPAVADGALGALTKLSQVMPAALHERVAAMTSVVVDVGQASGRSTRAGLGGGGAGEEVESMMGLAVASARNERVRFDYRSGDGVETVRHVEPFRLVSATQRWYLVAFDVDRQDWRTFRVDRVTRVRNTGARFQRVDPPDPARYVAEGLAVNSYASRALVRIQSPLDEVLREIAPTIGVARVDPDDPDFTIVEIGGDDDWVARYLAGIEAPYEVLEPASLRDELRRLGHRLVTENPRRRRRPTNTPVAQRSIARAAQRQVGAEGP